MVGTGESKFSGEESAHISWWAVKRYFEINSHSPIENVVFIAKGDQAQNYIKYWQENFMFSLPSEENKEMWNPMDPP